MRRWGRLGGLGACALLLAACQTTPLPQWPPAPIEDGTESQNQPAVPRYALADYSDAIAARYPDPPAQYYTAGLSPERSVWSSNGEILSFLNNLAEGSVPGVQSQVIGIGRSQKGETIHAMLIGRDITPSLSAAGFANSKKPTILLVGGQRGDEPVGTETLLVAAQQFMHGEWSRWLGQMNVIVVPRLNPDGAQTGSATVVNQIDLEHDHLLLRTPEARALAQVLRDFRPLVVVDSQEYPVSHYLQPHYPGMAFYDALLQYGQAPNMGNFVGKAAREWFVDPVVTALQAQNLSSHWYHRAVGTQQRPSVGMGHARPESLRNVQGLRHSVALVVASRGVGLQKTHAQRRVHSHITVLSKVLEQTATRAADLEKVRSFVTREAASQACKGTLVVQAEARQEQRSLVWLTPVSGERQEAQLPWASTLELRTLTQRPRPCGYLLAATETDAVERLQLLGVNVLRVAEEGALQVQRYNAVRQQQVSPPADRTGIAEKAPARTLVEVGLRPQRLNAAAGSYYVPMGQAMANLAAAALEPDTLSSFFANQVTRSLDSVARVVEPPKLVFEELE